MSTNVKAEMEQLIAAYSEIEGPSVKRPLTSEIKRFVSYLLASNGKISDGVLSSSVAFLGGRSPRRSWQTISPLRTFSARSFQRRFPMCSSAIFIIPLRPTAM